MVLRRVRGIRRLALVGVNDLHEPADLLAADDDALHRLRDHSGRPPRAAGH